ncbi:uncharacterized protein LOC121255014 [Juglans microcarpa x Juglans regia]|uniref:uncharacterized protein LOC121255014 n=1 Tax=Juglans microcarpa x Juglans regia TaxID=2249226 RepID=UPI001B7EFA6E|nr:uncharacterized protein LOC121255014 [Juglans microcarpa x Juglans regia]
MALNPTTREIEENRRAMDAMRRDNNASLERLERRSAETNGKGAPPSPHGQRQEVFVDGVETSVTSSMHEPPRPEYRRGERVENDQVVVDRWIRDDVHHSRSPSILREPQDVRFEVPRFEEHHKAEYDFSHGGLNGHDDHAHRRHFNRGRERGHRNRRHEEDHYDDRVGNRAHDRGPRRPKEVERSASKLKPYEVKKLSREEVQERIKNGLCFKCGDKWSKEHKCKAGQAYVMLEDETIEEEEEDGHVETTSEESELEEAKSSEPLEEAELSLNAISGVP